MITIIVNNHTSQLVAPTQIREEIRELMKIRAKNYFWSPAFRKRQWDGYVQYMTEKGGTFYTGLLEEVCEHLKTIKEKYTIEDNRGSFKDLHEVTELGGKEFRGYQAEALHALLNNKFKGIKFIRGILYEATNAGKSLIAAGVYASFSQKRKGLFLVNSKTLFTQALGDLQDLLGKDQVGWVSSEKGVNWQRVNVCMVQTLGLRMKKDPNIKNELAKQDIIIIDEYDEVVNRKDCQDILNNCYNAPIRVALTGSAQMSKDKNKNKAQIKYCGPIIHITTNKELVDSGVSSVPNIKFFMGNTNTTKMSYQDEYSKKIVRNKKRNKKIWRVARKKCKKGPVLIMYKLHEHAKKLMEVCPEDIRDTMRIKVIHGKTEGNQMVFESFNEGKVEILIASMIIKRGINLPRIRTLINAAGGDSEASIVQILGRSLRKLAGIKEEVEVIEFFDQGTYIQRHSKHRISYYKKQNFPVRELYKQKL